MDRGNYILALRESRNEMQTGIIMVSLYKRVYIFLIPDKGIHQIVKISFGNIPFHQMKGKDGPKESLGILKTSRKRKQKISRLSILSLWDYSCSKQKSKKGKEKSTNLQVTEIQKDKNPSLPFKKIKEERQEGCRLPEGRSLDYYKGITNNLYWHEIFFSISFRLLVPNL